MGGMDGVTMARRIRKEDDAMQMIFISGYSEYIAEGYEVAELHYLIKPIQEEKLFAVLDRAVEKRRQAEKCLAVVLSGEMVRVPLGEITHIDVHLNYATVHAKQEYRLKKSLSELDERFFRASRSLIVNLPCIRRVTKKEMHLMDGTVLPLPRGAYDAVNRAIIEHT